MPQPKLARASTAGRSNSSAFFVAALAACLAACALAFLFAGCKKQDNSVIRVGHFGAMTGPTATFGTSTDEGIRLAMEEINAKGGVLGKRIDVVTEDDQSKPTEAVNAVVKLLRGEKPPKRIVLPTRAITREP